MFTGSSSSLLSSPLLSSLLGCSDQDTDPPDVEDTDEGWLTTGGGQPGAEDQGLDETGPVLGTDTNDELANLCLIGPEEGYFGYIHQCEGGWSFHLGWVEDAEPPVEHVVGEGNSIFGPIAPGDSYSNPLVMACCDVYDPGNPNPPPQPHVTACYKDMVETLCFSMPAHVADAFSGFTGVGNLVNHVASEEGQESCSAAFQVEIDSWNPTEDEGPLNLTWNIGNSILWPTIENPYLEIINSGIIDVHIPNDPGEYIECSDNDLNNGQTLIGFEENPEYTLFLGEGDGVLVGPTYNSNPMAGGVTFDSDDTACVAPLCSYLSFSEESGGWTVHNLSFYSTAVSSISDQVMSYEIEWFHIQLVGSVEAEELGPDHFEIGQGDALFLLGGNVGGEAHHLLVRNASVIEIGLDDDVWKSTSFALSYSDSESDAWTLSVAGAHWVVP